MHARWEECIFAAQKTGLRRVAEARLGLPLQPQDVLAAEREHLLVRRERVRLR